jgi:hypothetical protein
MLCHVIVSGVDTSNMMNIYPVVKDVYIVYDDYIIENEVNYGNRYRMAGARKRDVEIGVEA